jgi:hypothetical protein
MTPLFRPGTPPALRRLSQLSILFAMASLIATAGGLTILPAATWAGQAILAAFGIAATAAAFLFGTLINLNRPQARGAGFVAVAVLLPTAVLFGLIAYVAPDSAWLFATWGATMGGYAALATHRLVRWPTGSLADEPKSGLGIFISYRRQDTIETIGRIRDYLCEAFEEDRVFLDVVRQSAGDDYRAVIDRALARSDIMLVVIGMEWLDAPTADGRRRLDDREDMVRIEIETALAKNVRVVPVLVEGAPMPPAAKLPPSLQPLAYRSALPLRPDPDFVADMLRLVDALRDSGANHPATQPAGLPVR